jgi:protease PrsW
MTDFSLFWAALGGILPALLWLMFWLREDKRRPEPRGLLFVTFLGGMLAVLLVIPFEKFIAAHSTNPTTTVVLWSFVEELFKFGAAYLLALRSRYYDEPIDAVIYLITAALGFAALENVFFILGPLQGGDILGGLVTGNLRFVGATLLHTVTSGIIGVSIAFSFYRHRRIKKRYATLGFILAVLLHALFNFFIMQSTGNGLFGIFGVVWLGVVILIFVFERIKRLKPHILLAKK